MSARLDQEREAITWQQEGEKALSYSSPQPNSMVQIS